jgi:NADH:ubiquinone oxidoreductase subunit 3 (subunit A)
MVVVVVVLLGLLQALLPILAVLEAAQEITSVQALRVVGIHQSLPQAKGITAAHLGLALLIMALEVEVVHLLLVGMELAQLAAMVGQELHP